MPAKNSIYSGSCLHSYSCRAARSIKYWHPIFQRMESRNQSGSAYVKRMYLLGPDVAEQSFIYKPEPNSRHPEEGCAYRRVFGPDSGNRPESYTMEIANN